MVLLNHGIFSFGETAREGYERMIELVTLAEKYLESKRPGRFAAGPSQPAKPLASAQAELRHQLSDASGLP